MSISITITDGTDTITIAPSSSDAYLETYQPEAPEINADQIAESLEVTFYGGNSTVDAAIAKLEKLFTRARARAGGLTGIAPVYLKITLDSATWRSELYGGKLTETPEWIKGERANGTRSGALILSRAGHWEDDTERQISLTNDNGTDNTAGLRVFNINDASGSSPNKHVNYAEITAAKVSGDLPAPVRIVLTPDAAACQIDDLMIYHNAFSDPGGLVTIWEDNAGSDVSDADASGGIYKTRSAGGGQFYRDVSSIANSAKGNYFRVLARLKGTTGHPNIFKIRAWASDLYNASQAPLTTINLNSVLNNLYWFDLGILRLPPNYIPGGITYVSMGLYFGYDCDAADILNIDVVHLAALDGWKRITLLSYMDNGQSLILDEIQNLLYIKNSSGYILRFGSSSGSPLRVYPGQLQRFQFIWQKLLTHSSSISQALVQLYYRPRRRAL